MYLRRECENEKSHIIQTSNISATSFPIHKKKHCTRNEEGKQMKTSQPNKTTTHTMPKHTRVHVYSCLGYCFFHGLLSKNFEIRFIAFISKSN